MPTFRYYRSAEILNATKGARCSALTRYITADGETGFWDWTHEIRPIRYALAYCDSSIHALCAADPEIKPYSPELADLAAVQAWLDSPLSSVSQTIRDQIENDGFSTSWATGATTRRAAFLYISRVHVMLQELRRLKDIDSMEMFDRGLDTTIGSLTVQVRNKVGTWMTNRGLETAWITGPTLVREVIQYIHDNLNWPILQFGPHKF